MMLGKYQLVSKLATGGMAEVYLARAEGPRGFSKSLVVKRILPHLAEDPQFVEMFISEARLAARLDHPNIVQIFDFGKVDGTWFLAMEYIDGLNLRVLARHGKAAGMPLPPAYCARIIASACEGLAFAHDSKDAVTGEPLGLIHRDISPDNILLSHQGAVKVVDFGIAKAANQGHKTQSGIIKGKLAYMPPEQLLGLALDRRVDVYALGVVLYELLTGHRPFEAPAEDSIMHAILHEPFVPAAERRPDLPPVLGRTLERALAKNREQRYPDCRAFQADLEHFILSAGEPVGAWNLAQLVARVMATTVSPAAKPVSGSASPNEIPGKETPGKQAPSRQADLATETMRKGNVPAIRRRGPWMGRIAAGVGATVLLVLAGHWVLRDEVPARATPGVSGPTTPVPLPETPTPTEAERPALSVPPAPARDEPPAAPADMPPAPEQLKPVRGVRPQTPPPVAAARTGIVEFRIWPYATVWLDGKHLGETPLEPVTLSAGRHTVKLLNQELGKNVTLQVEVRADETLVVRRNLQEE